MAGKHINLRPPSISSPFVFASLSLLALFSLFFFFFFSSSFFSSSHCITSSNSLSFPLLPLSRLNPNPNPAADYSFVASLEKFLASHPPPYPSGDGGYATASVEALDEAVSEQEVGRFFGDMSLDPVLRVYVYEMPAKFTYDLLRLFRDTYKETDNLTSNGSPVHRLIEQHSIDYWLWADLIAPESKRVLKNVIRVHRPEDAHVFYIPFFTTISYFLLEKQQCKALYRVWVSI